MAEPAARFPEPHERAAGLRKIGVTEERVRRVVARGLQARLACTPFHPPMFPGVAQWADSHRALREEYVPEGWIPDDAGNYSVTIRPDGEVAIAIATGDDRTGIPGTPQPRTRHQRGQRTHDAVSENQLVLFGPSGELRVAAEEPLKRLTYYLLIHVRHDEVRVELSLPERIDDTGRICSWSERNFIAPLAIELPRLDDEDDPGMDIDVPVERL